MRFSDIRQIVIKRTGAVAVETEETREFHPTPRQLSPYEGVTRKIRKGVAAADILQPTYNRASRRRAGQVKARSRISGVAMPAAAMPWRSTEVPNA